MKSTKTTPLVIAGLLVLSGLWFLPSVAGQGPESSLPQRVAVLEALVADLSERVDHLEGGSCSCTILNLQSLDDLPGNPTDGDLCVAPGEYQPGEYSNVLYYGVDGNWVQLVGPISLTPPT